MTTVKKHSWLTRTAAVAFAGALLAGCAGQDAGSGAEDGGTGAPAAEATVDPAALDTGDYPTEPAPPFGVATTEDILDVEGQRMAEYVTIPFEVDPELTFTGGALNVIRSASLLDGVITPNAGDVARENTMLYGYTTSATKAPITEAEPTHQLILTVLRFESPEGAAATAERLHGDMLTGDWAVEPYEDLTLTGQPETRAVAGGYPDSDTGGQDTVLSLTPHGNYLIFTMTSAPRGERSWAAETASKAVGLQKPLIDRFPATPNRKQNGGVAPEMPQVDQGRIQIYALPTDEVKNPSGDDRAGYGPRGMAHRSGDPRTLEVLTETGSEHNAVGDSTVYRASDEAGAEKIHDMLLNQLRSQGAVDEPAPEGLPVATCLSLATRFGVEDHCLLREGRYVGTVGALSAVGEEKKEDVRQRISAQYLILQKADQNA